jgi:hypothetical protein
MDTSNIERYLESFGKYIVKQSRANLTRKKKNVNRDLYNSIKFKIEENNDGFSLKLFMLDYGKFVDKGVSGFKKIQEYRTYDGRKVASPFQYSGGAKTGGLRKGIAKWIKQRGIKGRVKKEWKSAGNKGGQFISDKSLVFLISRKIYLQGIKSTSFFQRPLGLALESFNTDLLDSVKEDILNNLTKVEWQRQ